MTHHNRLHLTGEVDDVVIGDAWIEQVGNPSGIETPLAKALDDTPGNVHVG